MEDALLTDFSRTKENICVFVDMVANTPPQANQKQSTEILIDRGSDVHLPCFVQSHPTPIFS
jgi:hypothetical protein